MDRNVKRIGLINWLALLFATAGMVLVARYAASFAGLMAAAVCGLGLLVSLLSYCQMSLEGREQLEKLDLDELSKSRRAPPPFSTRRRRTLSRRAGPGSNSSATSSRS